MKTLKNIIKEGFFNNVGNDRAVVRDLIIDFLDRASQEKNGFDAIRLKKQIEADPEKNTLYIISSNISIFITPTVLGEDKENLPKWLVFSGTTKGLDLYIDGFQNLSSLKGLPNELRGLHITNCPKLVSLQGFPQKIGYRGLEFLPDEDTTYLYKDIVKKVREIKGPLIIHKKALDYSEPKKEKLPTMKDVKATPNVSRDVLRARELGQTLGKIYLERHTPEDSNIPTWTMEKDEYIVYDDKGNVIGFTTKKFNIIYRKGVKIMTIVTDAKDQMMYGYDLQNIPICRLELITRK